MRRLLTLLLCLFAFATASAQAAPGDTLERVVILMRHGVRSAMATPEQLGRFSVRPWPAFDVPPGNLTAHGARLVTYLGVYYHDIYVRDGLLNGKDDCGKVYYWANHVPRTEATAAALAEGLTPGCANTVHHISEGFDPLFDAQKAGIGKADPERIRAAISARVHGDLAGWDAAQRPRLDRLEALLWQCPQTPCASQTAPAGVERFYDAPLTLKVSGDALKIDSPAIATAGVIESLLMGYADGQDFAALGWKGVDSVTLSRLFGLHAAEFDLRLRTPEVGRQTSSYLADRLVKTLLNKPGAIGDGAPFVVLSGHDGTLIMLAGLLGLDWQLPGYGRGQASPGGGLVFELWRRGSDGQEVVRIHYIAQGLDQLRQQAPLSLTSPPEMADLALPGCVDKTDRPDCPAARFDTIVRGRIDPAYIR